MVEHNEIPTGDYCYTIIEVDYEAGVLTTRVCPHWVRNPDKPEQMNGYCSYLGVADWDEDSPGLLWDQVKECGINTEE